MPAIHLTEPERAQLEQVCRTLGMSTLAAALRRECLHCRRLTTEPCDHQTNTLTRQT